MATKKFLDLDGLSRVWGKITNKFALKSIYGDSTINFGRKTGTTTGTNSVAAGYEATASGAYSHSEGYKTTASGGYSHAEGSSTTSSGSYSHAEGSGTTASSSCTHAEGLNSIAKGSYSHAEGGGTFARGNYSHTEGRENVSSGNNSHAEGFTNIAAGVSSHAEGGTTAATVTVSGAANATTYTTSDTSNLRVDGYVRYDNTTSRIISITENTSFELATTLSEEALTDATVTIFSNVASGSYSHVEGQKTMANASSAHAEGVKTTASGNNSHVEGNSVIVQSKSQHAQGEYNIVDGTGGASTRGTYADVVGNGTAENARSNAYTLGWDGEGWFAGDVYTGSTSGTNKDAGSKKLATEEYVNTNYGKKIASIQSFFGASSSTSTQPDRWTLPAGYQEIEYLQSTATEIINTGVDAIDVRKIECKFATMNYTGSQYITGARASNPNTILFAIDGSSTVTKFSALYNAASIITTDIDRVNGAVVETSIEISDAVDGKRTMTFKCKNGTYDETITKSNVADLETTGYNIHIFGWNTNNKTACRIYREKIYTDNGLVRDYVPCLNKITGKYGLYDMVNNQFYTSTVDFTLYGSNATYIPQLTSDTPYLWKYDIITYVDDTTQKNAPYVIEQKSGSGGTSDYTDLTNKPQINSVTLTGDMSYDDLGIASKSYVDSLVSEGATKTILYNGKANNTAVMSGNIQQLTDSIFNYDLIVVGFNCLVPTVGRYMEICDCVYPNASLIEWCGTTGADANGAHHIFNSNQNFANLFRVMWGFTDATHIRNIVSNHTSTGTYGWTDEGICYVIGYKFKQITNISGQKVYDMINVFEGSNWEAATLDPTIAKLKATATTIKDQLDEIKATLTNGCAVQLEEITSNPSGASHTNITYNFATLNVPNGLKGFMLYPVTTDNVSHNLTYFTDAPAGYEEIKDVWLRDLEM